MNPKMDKVSLEQTRRIQKRAVQLTAHLWVQSSGSSQRHGESPKWLALSKAAFLVSAAGVNQHLQVARDDVWGVALPLFHVSGLSILARASLTGSSVVEWSNPWEPTKFSNWLRDQQVTLLSLVPTQLHDLVEAQLTPAPRLRAVVLGGARLEDSLYQKAKSLGWPVLPSFGMTEFCSQVATARLDSSDLILLKHIEAKTDADQILWIRSAAMFTGFLQERDHKIFYETPSLENGFWKTADRAVIAGNVMQPQGRGIDFVKIKGEGLNLLELRSRFEWWVQQNHPEISPLSFALAAIADPREGSKLVLVSDANAAADKGFALQTLIDHWNQVAFPIERFSLVRVLQIPRSPLGKVLWGQLEKMIK